MIYEFGKMIVNLKKLLEMTTNNVSVLEERVKLLESQNKELIHELNNHTRFINNIIKNNDNNISLMAESVRRGLATVESDRLPQWAIAMINHMIDACNIKNEDYALGYLAALDDVLYLRKPEEKE